MSSVFKVYDKGAGYFLIPAPTEATARKRAAELRIKTVVRVEPHTPKPWPDPATLVAREARRERGRRSAAKRLARLQGV